MAALLSGNSADYVVILSALWNLGACVIPLNILLSDSELTEIINFSDAEFLFYAGNEMRDLSIDIPQFEFSTVTQASDNFEPPGIDSDALSLLMFTSGATGKPKGVMHSMANLLNSADTGGTFLKQTSDDRWLASLPFYHIGGLSIIIRTFRYGSSLIIPSSLKIDSLIAAFKSHNPSYASLVSTQLGRMLETWMDAVSRLKKYPSRRRLRG